MYTYTDIFADGGVIGANPSVHGGTWAWVAVNGDGVVRSASGIVTPEDIDTSKVTNNQSEALAVLRALEAVPGYAGQPVHTDSKVTMHRFTTSQKFNGLPNWLRLRILEIRRRLRPKIILVGGHATAAELCAGRLRRNCLPTSKWNGFCDAECSRLAAAFLARKGEKP